MHRPRIDIGSWAISYRRVLFMTGKHSSVQRRQTLKSIWIYDTCTDYYYFIYHNTDYRKSGIDVL